MRSIVKFWVYEFGFVNQNTFFEEVSFHLLIDFFKKYLSLDEYQNEHSNRISTHRNEGRRRVRGIYVQLRNVKIYDTCEYLGIIKSGDKGCSV